MTTPATVRWYREPWPWLLMSGPAAVVVAGVLTTVIAVRSADGVVADDYYKQGLAINRVLERGVQARVLGVRAGVTFDHARNTVVVQLTSNAPFPQHVRLRLVHPTRQGMDRVVTLSQTTKGRYEGHLDPAGAANWLVSLEDERSSWRVEGRWHTPETAITLTPAK
jgi:hypothetical protein